MKTFKLILIGLILTFGIPSCQSVRVATDYDEDVDFDQYKTYAFYKPGIDQAQISDLDKRRILKAIDHSLSEKGMTKSQDAQLLISIFTESTEEIDVYPHYGWYNPWYGHSRTSSQTKGTLYIDLVDSQSKNLIWQGVGVGVIEPDANMERKNERIQKIVTEILNKFPPKKK